MRNHYKHPHFPDLTFVKNLLLGLSLATILITPAAFAGEHQEPMLWGVAFGLRTAQVIYSNSEANSVEDVIPLIYYDDGDYLFLHGLKAGIRLFNKDPWQFSALASYRFLDIPASLQNDIRGNALDLGVQLKYRLSPQFDVDLEVLNDQEGRYHTNLIADYDLYLNKWQLSPYAKLRWKTAEFNNYYYGLDIDTPGSGFDATFGADVRYHVTSNFYLAGGGSILLLDQNTSSISTINSQSQSALYLGIGFFNDKRKKRGRELKSKPYVRLSYGWATSSSLGEIIAFDAEPDPYNNTMASVFYGHPLSDSLFGLPISMYLTPGLAYHFESEVQASFPEYVLAVKGYYTINWPISWRVGTGIGLSYLTHITYIEQQEMDKNNYKASKTMAYLDFSLDLNLGDLFNAKSMNELWLGTGIHHRSGIYETSSAFGRIKGGSNYITAYLQYHW